MENKSLEELSSLVKDIHVKTREASQNTNLDMWGFLEIDKALQSIQGKLLKNTSKLTEINKLIKIDTKKLEEVENDLTHTDEQRQLYRDRLDNLNIEKQTKLEILSQKQKDLQTQVARIKKTLGKFFDKNTSLAERNSYLISWTGDSHIFNTDCLFNDYFNDCACHYRRLWRRQGDKRFSTKRRKGLEKKVRQASKRAQNTCRKGRWGIACCCRKCCWCYFKFTRKGRWICCWTYMRPNCFCCMTYWCMVDAKS